ncbi:MAG: hypothetical protein ACRCZ0_11360 [Cetobacterium sp.]
MYFTSFNKADAVLTTDQMLNNIAWLYAQFSLTFDPAMIATPSTQHPIASTSQAQVNDASDSLLPIYQYFKDNDEVVDKYKSVVAFFETRHQLKIFPSFSANELESRFTQRIHFYQNEIIKQNQRPLTFEAFYQLFKRCHVEGYEKEEDDTDEKDKKFKNQISISTLQQDHPFIQQFCHYRQSSDNEIKNSLKQFKLRSYVPSDSANRLNRRDLNYLKLSNKFVEHLKGTKEPKPRKIDFSIHHMIPSATIEKFYQYYFELLSQKSDKLVQSNQFDWIKVQEIQSQFAFLVDADKLWKKYGKEDGKTHERPIDNYDKNQNSAQEDFIRFWFRFPPGLLFYGPKGEIRKDDPSYDKNRRNEYTNFPNDFEERVIYIVGKEYYDKVAKLNTEILEFNTAYESRSARSDPKTVDELNKIAMKINNRLRTIYREAPWANQIIAPFETDDWKKGDPLPKPRPRAQIWEIVKNDWGIKTLAQQSDLADQFSSLSIASSIAILTNEISQQFYPSHDELKRKKRQHSSDERLFYVQMLDMKCEAVVRKPLTTTEKPTGFWCSPFYLRLNPMMYLPCRLSGHQNLHFF